MTTLPEYDDNAYIAGLPPILGAKALAERLARPPSYDRAEKLIAPTFRRHAVQRLRRYFRPSKRHLLFAEQFDMLLRQGYVGRAPSERRGEARILEVADQARERVLLSASRSLGLDGTAASAVLVGMPGMGKTHTVNHVLRSYPQVIEHVGLPAQIVWIKLETPIKGSLRALCVAFFHEVDSLLGQEIYTRLYAGSSASEETMMLHMALVANYHALGCLVIDEIQHLPKRQDDHELLTFLVTLTNKIGVPVLFIGTMNAMDMFSRTARMSRRSVGNACGVWRNYAADDGEWTTFMNDLWQYQWTFGTTSPAPDLLALFHEETQGVVDFAVKLFALVQMRVILRSNGDASYPELIDVGIVREVIEEDFGPAREFIDALRSGDMAKIAKLDDLTHFNAHYDSVTAGLIDPPVEVTLSSPRQRLEEEVAAPVPDVAEQAVRAELLGRGFGSDIVDKVLAEAKIELGSGMTLSTLLSKVEKMLAPPRRKASDPVQILDDDLPDNDLRRIARKAAGGRTVCEALAAAGMGGRVALELAA